MAKKNLPNTIGVFSELTPVGVVVSAVCYDVQEFINARESNCDLAGCKSCKYFSNSFKRCSRPPLVIHFEPFEK